jgi:hypothetical protein
MKNYTVLFAEDVPHYCTVDIEANSVEQAIEKAKDHPNAGNLDFGEADWNNPVCFRIVHIEDAEGKVVVDDLPLDDFFLRGGGAPDRRLCENAEDMLKALEASHSSDWVHNAGITNDIEALRKICLAHVGWWNNIAWPLIERVKGGAA